jgi:aldose 1-epimerase
MGGRFRVYDAEQISDASLALSLTYADAEDADAAQGISGFPGTLQVKVVYTVTEANELKLEYSGTVSDKKTILNLTSHPFFNLSNHPDSTTLDHVVQVNADQVLEINDRLLPTGVLRDVTGTPMDFRTAKPLGQDYQASHDLLNLVGGGGAGVAGGYDNTYVVTKTSAGELSFAASAYEPTSGRKLEIWSTEPGIQVFSGQGLTGQMPRDVGKGAVTYQQFYGFAMEPMRYPDSPNQPSFPSTTLAPNASYTGEILFKFSVQP